MATFGTFAAGQVLTAGELNAAGTYTAYTPTWTNLTVGNGVNDFRYCKFNKLVHMYGQFKLGTTSAVTGNIQMSLPVTAKLAGGFTQQGCAFEDPGNALYMGVCYFNTTTQMYLWAIGTNGNYARDAGSSATVPMTWANNDIINVNIIYEAA